MSIFIQKQKQLETLKRQENLFNSQLDELCSILDLDPTSTKNKYNDLLSNQYDILNTYDNLFKEYISLDNTKSLLFKNMLDSSKVDVVNFILSSKKPNHMLDVLFKLGVVSGGQYEYVKDYMWNNRTTQMYNPQTSYYQDAK